MVHGNYNYDFESCVLFQQIDAHRSPLVAMIFSSSGTYLATASQQGTIIRVHLVSQATEVAANLKFDIPRLFGMISCIEMHIIYV